MIIYDYRHPIVSQLLCMDFKFYLIGSRFMGTSTEYSDYDFYAAAPKHSDEKEIGSVLQSLGFTRVQGGGRGYCTDKKLESVYHWDGSKVPSVDVLIAEPGIIAERMSLLREIKKLGYAHLMKALKNDGTAFSEFCEFCQLVKGGP